MNISRGDRVDIVVDLVPEVRDGYLFQVVHIRGVFPPGSTDHPPIPDGARRNVVQWWYDVPNAETFMGAFAIDTGPEEDTP